VLEPLTQPAIGGHPSTDDEPSQAGTLARPKRLRHQDIHRRFLETRRHIRHKLPIQLAVSSEFGVRSSE
jgi:hypothetical protein